MWCRRQKAENRRQKEFFLLLLLFFSAWGFAQQQNNQEFIITIDSIAPLYLSDFKWQSRDEANDVIYEDDRFCVLYLDFGEWGGATWFRDKIDGKEYELASDGYIVNKANSIYYITTKRQILMIEDPKQLRACKYLSHFSLYYSDKNSMNNTQIVYTSEPLESFDYQYYYDIIKDIGIRNPSHSLKGTKTIYMDSTYKWWSFDEYKSSYIITSFVSNNELFHLYNDGDNETISIVKLDNGNLIPIMEIAKNISVFNTWYYYRIKIQKDGTQLIAFKTTNDPILFGFIEIYGNKITVHYKK